ncbi:ubiquilin-1-like [Malaclemys terrapin pileata]|uniref:ubiquilin-1-like n=1 Tax=Malaclemys terrapin pileata TaxID=2991368 RepID=UPI0023A7F599|nr:ubiquilin-1-like [Malaclemys terrapin pileata]
MVRSGDVPGARLEAAAAPRVIKVTVKTPGQKEEFVVPEDRLIKEFKAGISTRFSSPTDRLVLIFAGRILKDQKTLSQHGIQDDATIYLVIQSRRRPQECLGQHAGSPEGAAATQAENSSLSSTAFGTDGLRELASNLGLNTANFSEFQSQLTSNPEMMFQLLENPFIQSRLCNPDLMTELITDNPLKQQVIQKTPEIGHFLNTPDMLKLILELARSPATVREIMKDPSQALSFLASLLGGDSASQHVGRDRPDLTLKAVQTQAAGNAFASPRSNSSLASSQTPSPPACTPPSRSPGNTINSGLGCCCSITDCTAQSCTGATPGPGRGAGATVSTTIKNLLQQAVKRLVQNILVGPAARSVRQLLGQNRDLGTQAPLQNPPTAGKPPMQPLPTFHQQIWHPEVVAAMPGPREMQVPALIQHRLQALAMGEPGIPLQFLSPLAESGHAAGSAGTAPSSAGLEEAAHPASAAPSQQFTAQQMLQALAGANPQQAQNL